MIDSVRPNRSQKKRSKKSARLNIGGTTDNMTSEDRSRTMSRIRSRDTRPEKLVRQIAHRLGFRFRLCRRDLPGCPDLVFPRLQCVIFVHGCFWHSHSCKKGRRKPFNNALHWKTKLKKNVARDRAAVRKLRRVGWRVLVLWECEIRNLEKLESQIDSFLKADL